MFSGKVCTKYLHKAGNGSAVPCHSLRSAEYNQEFILQRSLIRELESIFVYYRVETALSDSRSNRT